MKNVVLEFYSYLSKTMFDMSSCDMFKGVSVWYSLLLWKVMLQYNLRFSFLLLLLLEGQVDWWDYEFLSWG